MLVRDVMTSNPMCGHPDMPVEEVRKLMKENGFRHLPIVDEQKNLVGLVTQGSLAGTIQADHQMLSQHEVKYILAKVKARDIMITNMITTTEDTPIEEAARVMSDRKISCLPVTRDSKPVGIVTDSDVFALMSTLLGARRAGTRVTVLMADRAGQAARLTKAIADKGGYLSVFVAYPTADPSTWAFVCKVTNVDDETLVETLKGLPEVEVKDVRRV